MPARTATDLFAATARLLTATVGRVEAEALMVNIVCVSVCRPTSVVSLGAQILSDRSMVYVWHIYMCKQY